MKDTFVKYVRGAVICTATCAVLFSCKDELVVDALYPDQNIYLAQAAVATTGPTANGVYYISPNITGQAFKFVADGAAGKFNIPMSVQRSGINMNGSVAVNLTVNTDTIAKFIALGTLPAGTELLPAAAYTLPNTLNIENGTNGTAFNLVVDLNFLKTNLTKKYAIGVAITSGAGKAVNTKLGTAVIYLEPAVALLPAASFSNYVYNYNRTANFDNASSNAVSFVWNFGDGSPAETKTSTSHKYAAAGTYIVSLTATGVTGATSVQTTPVVIP